MVSIVSVEVSVESVSPLPNSQKANAVKPMSITVNSEARRLKYLSMKTLIGAPNFQMSQPIRKNRIPRATIEAMMNITKLISNIPPATVKSLNGSGVKPAVKTIQKLNLS